MFFLLPLQLCHKEGTDGATTMSSETKKERSSTLRQKMINFVKPGETAQRQPTQKTSILNGATRWSMKVDLDDKLVFTSIVKTNLGPDIVLWSKAG
ncbi:hypothetical protein DPMN_186628 [Dreissena polymorpha]|uniref:Uncharacterized protein n=1 Tax=Dreissena polymorpha TaxID=45954 RepID=A0A9D4I8C2_DREPO|nr:hypothetical protein DPMN_186628 [Dreissena polymorpha]